jgi:putative ABC transport system permease protein
VLLDLVIDAVGMRSRLAHRPSELSRRTHEFGLLRAVGASRRQIRAIVRLESEITALLGAVQGVVIGVVLGWASCSRSAIKGSASSACR